MDVVYHQIGNPRRSTINQNEVTTDVLLLMSDGFSGGGSVTAGVATLPSTTSAAAAAAAEVNPASTGVSAIAPTAMIAVMGNVSGTSSWS